MPGLCHENAAAATAACSSSSSSSSNSSAAHILPMGMPGVWPEKVWVLTMWPSLIMRLEAWRSGRLDILVPSWLTPPPAAYLASSPSASWISSCWCLRMHLCTWRCGGCRAWVRWVVRWVQHGGKQHLPGWEERRLLPPHLMCSVRAGTSHLYRAVQANPRPFGQPL